MKLTTQTNTSKSEAEVVCELLNEAFYELLEQVTSMTTDALQETFETADSNSLRDYVNKLVFDKEHEVTFVSVMSKELTLQLTDAVINEK